MSHRRRYDSVSADQLPALRKSLVWFTINLSGETQKSLVPCGGTMTHCNPAGPPEHQSTVFIPGAELHPAPGETGFVMGSQQQSLRQNTGCYHPLPTLGAHTSTHARTCKHTHTHTEKKDIICIRRAENELTVLSCCALLTWRTDSVKFNAVLESLMRLHKHLRTLPWKHCSPTAE